MKGSSSTKLKARAMLVYEDVAREGVIVTSNIGKSVQTPGMASLSFQMFVIKEHYINGVPDSLQDGVPKKDEPTFTFFSSAPQTNIDEQYSINYVDVTPPVDANGRHTATTPNPKDTPQQAALHVVDSLASIEQDQIEAAIRKNAFEGERLVRPSGSFVLNLSSTSNAVVHKSAQVIADKIFQMEHVPPTQAGGSITLPVQTGVK
jgi:hypothetical protein